MTAPVFATEGARLGGLTATTVAMVARTNSNGSRLYLDVYADEVRTSLVTSSSAATLDAGNNYQATAYVTGLLPSRRYWWRARADDGAAGSTNGTEIGCTAGTFRTHASASAPWRAVVLGCNPNRPQQNTVSPYVERVTANWRNLRADFAIQTGDIYYSDINTVVAGSDYVSGTWRNPATDADATMAAYRTNFITCWDHLVRNSRPNHFGQFFANTPTYWMWDDHDRCKDDCSDRAGAGGDLATRWTTGRNSGHELFMALNKALIDAEDVALGTSRAWTAKSSEDSYYYVDVYPVRFVVLDCRTYRSANAATDNSSKTMLGTTQKAWLKARIVDNPCKFLAICSPVMFDGFHGFNESTVDGWVGFATERDEILDYIWANGDPQRTIIFSGDTHNGSVLRYQGKGDARPAIYEVTAGNALWLPSAHGYINGLKGGTTGLGALRVAIRAADGEAVETEVNCNATLIESFGDCLRVSLVETWANAVSWSRWFA